MYDISLLAYHGDGKIYVMIRHILWWWYLRDVVGYVFLGGWLLSWLAWRWPCAPLISFSLPQYDRARHANENILHRIKRLWVRWRHAVSSLVTEKAGSFCFSTTLHSISSYLLNMVLTTDNPFPFYFRLSNDKNFAKKWRVAITFLTVHINHFLN